MRNAFDIEVCFNDYPMMPYEWETSASLLHVKLNRVSSRTLQEILTFEGTILNASSKILLISDTKETLALKLNKDGNIIKRSFLQFDKSLDVCEFAYNLRQSKLEFKKGTKRVKYPKVESVEEEVKNYIVNTVKKTTDEDFKRYLYYLYCSEIKNYSKEELIKSIEQASLEVNMKLYKFLIES